MLSLLDTTIINTSPHPDTVANGPFKILLVDDEPNTVQLVRRILQADGHEVYEALDGEQALEMFYRVRPGLVLLDAVIPKADGVSVLKKIRKQDKTTGVIMFSALSSEMLALQVMQEGADDFVNKPFTLKTLRMHVRRVIDKVYLRQQNASLQQQLMAANEKLRHYMAPPLVQTLMASSSLPQLGGERQTVTVLFMDICNFTPIALEKSPDEVLQLLNDYFAFVSSVVQENGGMVDKIMGDGFMALFNAPVAQCDHATRAVCSALAINQKAAQWNLTHTPPLYPRVGIHTGEAVVGNIGTPMHMNFTAIGDTVNLAKRFEQAINANEIMISADTYGLINWSEMDLCKRCITPVGPVIFKGREDAPVDVYKISLQPAVESLLMDEE